MFSLRLGKLSLENSLKFLLSTFLFLLPWQTVYIFREVFLAGTKIEYWTLNFYGTEILLWIIACLFIVWYWEKFKIQNSKFKIVFSKDRVFIFSVLLFILYFLLSTLWAIDKSLALQQSVRVMEAMLLFFILFLGPLKFKEAVKYILLGSLVPAVLGIGQFLLQTTFAFKWLGLAEHISSEPGASVIVGENIGRWLRAYGSFNHPNIFGGYLALLIMGFQISYPQGIPLRGDFRLQNKKLSVWLFFTSSLLITALFFTFSRSAWIVAVLVLIFIAIYKKQSRKILLLLIAYGLLLTALFFPIVQTRILGNSSHEVASVTERVSGYGEALEIFKTSPWLGVGAGNYTLAVYNLNSNSPAWTYQPVHNVGLLLLAELGIVGIALCLFVLVNFLMLLLISPKKEKVYVGLLLIAYCLLLSFDHYLYTSYIGLALSGVYWGLIVRDLHS